MLPSLLPAPDVPLKKFVARQWWALAASLAGALLVGATTTGSLVVLTLFLSAGYYVAHLVLLIASRPLLLKRAEELRTSRKRRLLTVLTTTAVAYALGFVMWLLQFSAGTIVTGAPMMWPDGQTWGWVAYAMTLPATIHVLAAWLLEWFGRRPEAKQQGVES
ncbi:hypothetical protein [Zhihengliuella salsuginis]|uniref:Uncharacterized protein n=1 Tax=Zhihengliuella salsuginis TaxID=578222 RepID=A0ABQ3GEQ0_9MICC|nr:hypothetical protein [Zhihengliuella salsuginis]GHD02360.1 hypothetical protein GCM10008096_07400 [Zhihengliuella salsuginis]